MQNITGFIQQIEQFKQTQSRIDYEIRSAQRFFNKMGNYRPGDIKNLLRQVRSFRNRARRIGYTYKGVVKQFDKVYGKTGDYAKSHEDWEKQSDASIKDAMVSQGLLERSDKHMADLDQVLKAKSKSEGNAETLQAISEVNAIQTKQLNDLTQIIATDARARHSVIMEERAKGQAQKQLEAQLMSDFNQHKNSRPLAYFPSLGTSAPQVQR